MSLTKETALQAIYSAIEEMNATLEPEKQLQKSADAIIYGPESQLDSIGLVNLVMAVEQQLYDVLGQEVLLASEAAMSRRRSPYRSADALADYAIEVVNGGGEQAS